jgi:ATP-binding cassette subfamily F protein 2
LNGVCSDMIHLTHKRKFVYYSGNYDTFVKTKVGALLQTPPPP